jgi:hypothetical protein
VAIGGDGALPNGSCGVAMLDVPWPVISGCLAPSSGGAYDFTRLRCAFPHQLNSPDYGAFVACCPPELPFGCPNGTPQSCYATASQAAVACGSDECQLCVPPYDQASGGAPPIFGGAGGVDGLAGAGPVGGVGGSSD